MAARSIAEETPEDESEDGDDDLTVWVNASRVRERLQADKKLQKRQRVKEEEINVAEHKEDKVVEVTQPSLPDKVSARSSMYVLADAPVVGGKDVLEDVTKPRKRERSPGIDGAKYDGTDTAEFVNKANSERGGVSAALEMIEVDNDYMADPSMEKVFAKRKKERKSFKKRKKETDTGAITTGRMEELREIERKQRMGESSDDDALYESLARARKVAREREIKRSVDTILQAINQANDDKGDEGDVMEDAEKIVYSEMEQFLQRLPARGAGSESDEDVAEGDERIAESESKQLRVGGGNEGIESAGNKVARGDAMNGEVSNGNDVADSNLKVVSSPVDDERKEGITPLDPQLGTESLFEESKIGGQSGVAAFLQRLRTTGDLKGKHIQHGRARDKRFSDEEREEEDRKKHGEAEIKLRYTDEHGNELTRKEAFRLLCHKFHGNGPGKNKREKRLRRMLESINARNMHSDDTPLASAAALKEETRRIGSAHVVLSGAQALPKKGKG